MAFIDRILQPPSYGWQHPDGSLVKPSPATIFKEFFSRLNIFKTKKNWLPFINWVKVLCLIPFAVFFFCFYFNWWLLVAAAIYGMIMMGTHGTIWHHRYCTHGAYTFRNNFWRFFTRNLSLAVIPEETYTVSHHVHHAKSDQPGDPYCAEAGFLYCFLADVNHQPIAKDLSEKDYEHALKLMRHTGVMANSYRQYQKWGSIANPWLTVLHWVLNWSFWYGVFYLIGGHPLACALFTGADVWTVGVRTFNYEGHGKGKDQRKQGTDYNWNDRSINQAWPGIVAGEWHNNHHLYPKSARAGFKPHQIDFAWYYIKFMHLIGAVSSYNDSTKSFYEEYYLPHQQARKMKPETVSLERNGRTASPTS